MNRLVTAALVAGFVLLLGIVGSFDYEDAVAEQESYCEMVALWKKTNGRYGWPAYEGEKQCQK